MISPDSCLVHKTWAHAPTEDGGLGGIHFPMMEVMVVTMVMDVMMTRIMVVMTMTMMTEVMMVTMTMIIMMMTMPTEDLEESISLLTQLQLLWPRGRSLIDDSNDRRTGDCQPPLPKSLVTDMPVLSV